jgi:hypothetical protein
MTTAGTLYDETVARGFGKLLGTATASNSASIIFASVLTSAYDSYWFEIDSLVNQTAINANNFVVNISSDGGNTWSNNYWYGGTSGYSGRSSYYAVNAAVDTSRIRGVQTSLNQWGLSGYLRMVGNPSDNSVYKHLWLWTAVHYDNSDYYTTFEITSGMNIVSLAAINAIKFSFSTGNIASGDIRVWGLRK